MQQARITAALVVLIGVYVGCGKEGDDSSGSDMPTCDAGQLILRGNLGEKSYDIDTTGFIKTNEKFTNSADNGGKYELVAVRKDKSEISLSLSFSRGIAEGETTSAYGVLDLTKHDGPKVGNCTKSAAGSALYKSKVDTAGYSFTFAGLREDPFCEGDDVEGGVHGCVGD